MIKRDKHSSFGMLPLNSPYIQEFKLGDAKPPHSNHLIPKKKWEKQCFEVFSRGLEEMHQELSKDGEDHKLGDVKTTPLDQHTLGLHTSKLCFSINALYRINLEHLLFACYFSLIYVCLETTTIIYI